MKKVRKVYFFKPGDKVICVQGYGYYGPKVTEGAECTVASCDKEFVYLEEHFGGRYGFYIRRFAKKEIVHV